MDEFLAAVIQLYAYYLDMLFCPWDYPLLDFLSIIYQILSYHRDTVDGCDDCQVPLMVKASWLGLQFGRVVSSKIGIGGLIKHFQRIVHPYRCHLWTGSLLQTSDLRSVTITLKFKPSKWVRTGQGPKCLFISLALNSFLLLIFYWALLAF